MDHIIAVEELNALEDRLECIE